ncbi:MAG: flavin reductase family protein [Sphingobium sp.]
MDQARDPASSEVDPQELRGVLGTFATGVTVMTTRSADGEPVGATVSSFNSVSLDPPLVLFSLARTAQALAVWEAAEGFAVNILTEDQTDISNRFARAQNDKWSGLAISPGPVMGFPLIPGALASMECAHFAHYDGGDHLIIVGRVVALQRSAETRRPLLFYGSRYRSLDTQHTIATPHDTGIWLHGW